jgi:hypothetical protein
MIKIIGIVLSMIVFSFEMSAQIDLPENLQKNTISIESSNVGILEKGEGITYLGNGIYKSVETGTTGFASFKKLSTKAIENFKAFADGYGCYFEIISTVKTSVKYGTGVPRATVTLKLFNKDGSLAITNSESKRKRDDIIKQIKELNELLELGVITEKEFNDKISPLKKILLDN